MRRLFAARLQHVDRPARRTRRPRRRAGLAVVAVATLAAGCSAAGAPGPAPSGAACTLGDLAVPTCGLLWGVAAKPPGLDTVQSIEAKVGRPFDIVYRYHDLFDSIPDKAEKDVLAAGKVLHISIATRDFGGTRPGTYTWAEVAKGTFDESLRAQARGIASIGKPVYLTFEQEASQQAKVDRLGPAADFVAAWRHLHELYAQEGVTNAVWVWVMTGAADNLQNAAQLWPGNELVDWISWNVYNQSGCKSGEISVDKYVSFADKMRVFYDWVHTDGPALGIDTTKPMMISETGSARYTNDLAKTAEWYASIPTVLEKYPQIRAVTLWASVDATDTACSYTFYDDATLSAGVRRAVTSGSVNVAKVTLP